MALKLLRLITHECGHVLITHCLKGLPCEPHKHASCTVLRLGAQTMGSAWHVHGAWSGLRVQQLLG